MSEEQMRVLRMIEEGKISAEDGAKLLSVLSAAALRGNGPTRPPPPPPPTPPTPPTPPIGMNARDRERFERDQERAERDRERAERDRERAEHDRERGRKDRGERGRTRGGSWVWGAAGEEDVFWGGRGRRGETRDTGPLPEAIPGGARWFRVRVTNARNGQVKVNVSLPIGLINFGLKLGARYVPGVDFEEIRQAVQSGMKGKLIEVEDTDEGDRVEIFVE